MKISIRDIGVIHKADIKLDGLTLIAGENGVGKSAISKVVYVLYKWHDKWHDSLIERLRPKVNNIMHSILLKVSEIYSSHGIDASPLQDFFSQSGELITINKLKSYIENITPTKYKKEISSVFEKHDLGYKSEIEREECIKSFESLMGSIFDDVITNKNSTNSIGKLKTEYDNGVIEFTFNDKKLENISETLLYPGKDATFLDANVPLSLHKYIKENLAFQNSQNSLLPDYVIDAVQKISESGYKPNYNRTICKEIKNIIGGHIIIINDNVVYRDENSNEYSMSIVASGIKSFGLLQLLLAGNKINENSLLIIDEPETHLHPIWQLKYAKVMVALAKRGIPILLTSHSSYFIEALSIYSRNEGIADKVNFYLGEMTDKGSIFREVTDNLEPIFDAFAKPMIQLIIEENRGKRERTQEANQSMVQEPNLPYGKSDPDKEEV